ncbi:MAG: hypothetical protein IPO90_17305 [Flavobacteriales bacterium]|nr:hypothetical protein [Flavobacteriales bacterium]
MIAKHLPHELDSYSGSMQNGGRGELDMQWPDNGYRLVLALSLIAAVWFGIRGIRDASGREQRIRSSSPWQRSSLAHGCALR